ncbi:hypothetical protein [Streptomyces sp. NPDC048106]|uniref:hypothetical protein n=1 Tax=Streptomyces sp. NPDC048106 TaxID=3155750 RepID=UPI003456A532
MSQPKDVAYDFDAALALSRACAQLREKLNWLVWMRGPNSAKYLDDQPDSWTGAKRVRFDAERERENRALHAFAEQAMTLMGRVEAATETATAEARKLLIHGTGSAG